MTKLIPHQLENQTKDKSEEEWSLMREKLSKYYKLFSDEKVSVYFI